MRKYPSLANAAYIEVQEKSRRVSPILIALVLAMAVLVYLILSATVGGGDLIAPRYHRHHFA